MAKQPYIPFYLGDYLKDTRILPLNVRGGWVDLILYMWDNAIRGELIGTYEDFARLMTCTKDEAVLVIQTLNQKNIFAYAELDGGAMKIESRKMKRMVKLSEIRQNAGKEGGNPALVKNLDNQKVNLNPEYENEYVLYLSEFNKLLSKKYKGTDKDKKQFMARLKGNYTRHDIISALKNAIADPFHIENKFRYLTPEFITRPDKLDKFSQLESNHKPSHRPIGTAQKEFGG